MFDNLYIWFTLKSKALEATQELGTGALEAKA